MNSGFNSGFICVIALCIACGYAIHCILRGHGITQQLRPGDILELFVLGSCGFVYAESLLLYAGVHMRPWHLPAFFAVLTVFCLWRRYRPVPVAWRRPAGTASRAVALLPFIFTALLLLECVVAMLNYPGADIDMLAHILIKGKIFANEGLWDSPYLNDPMFANMHSRYPLFPAIIYGNFYQWGPGNIGSYIFVNYLLVAGIAAALYSWLRNSLSPWMSALWAATYVSAQGFLDSVFIMSSMEIMLTGVFFCAARHFYEWKTTGRGYELCLAAAFAAMAALVKNDALLFGLVMLGTAACAGAGRAIWRPSVIWAVIVSPWLLVSLKLPDAATGPSYVFHNFTLAASLPNLRAALPAITTILLNGWNCAFLFAAVVFSCLLFAKKKNAAFWLIAVSAMTILGYGLIVWLSIGMISSFAEAFYRLLCPLYPFTLACVALALDTWAKLTARATSVQTDSLPQTTA